MRVDLLACAVAAALSFGVVLAQTAADSGTAEGAKLFEELIKAPVIPERTVEAIQADLTEADEDAKAAARAVTAAQARVDEAEGWRRTQKQAIDKISAEIKTANKEKRETDKITLEAERQKAQIVQQFLVKIKSVRQEELSLAKAARDVVAARRAARKSELDWIRKREAAINSSEAEFRKVGMGALEAQKKTIQLLKAEADKEQSVAGRQKRLADARIDLFSAREKLITSIAKPGDL